MKRFRTLTIAAFALAMTMAMGCFSLVDADEEGPYPCDIYCNIMMQQCDQTYSNVDQCYGACEDFASRPVEDENGDVIPLGAVVPNANSLECRVYHAENALQSYPNNVHCDHASPTGGAMCTDAGQACAGFCFRFYEACVEPSGGTTEEYFTCERNCDSLAANATLERNCRLSSLEDAETALAEGDDEGRRELCRQVLPAPGTTCLGITRD
jgi:hypothetical protein